MEKIDQGVESIEAMEAEMKHLMQRMVEVNEDAILRIEKLFADFRAEGVAVNRN